MGGRRTMKLSSGTYFNMYNETGYEDYGIPDLDIVFLFPESYTPEECQKLFDEIEEKTKVALAKYKKAYDQMVLENFIVHHVPYLIKMFIEKELNYLDIQIIVTCTCN